jgi:hypothetical protein
MLTWLPGTAAWIASVRSFMNVTRFSFCEAGTPSRSTFTPSPWPCTRATRFATAAWRAEALPRSVAIELPLMFVATRTTFTPAARAACLRAAT